MMNLFSFLRHKKVLFLISLPSTPEFEEKKILVDECIEKLTKEGVDVGLSINADILSQVTKYDAVIVVAHIDESTNELVLADSRMGIFTFIEALPSHFKGVLDFSSCYSTSWMALFKNRCPHGHIQGAMEQATLAYRLFIYPYVVSLFKRNQNLSYREAYLAIVAKTKDLMAVQPQAYYPDRIERKNHAVLGNPVSIIYAQKKIERGIPFIVQVVLKCPKDSTDYITFRAKQLDPHAKLISEQELSVKLRRGDVVAINYSVITLQKDLISIDDPTKTIIWNGHEEQRQFNVIVSKKFTDKSFNGRILIEVNRLPVLECSFKTLVEKKADSSPAELELKKHDSNAEMRECREIALMHILESYQKKQSELRSDVSENRRAELIREIKTLTALMEVIKNPQKGTLRKTKRIFISSTCEDFMKRFRDVICSVAKDLNLEVDDCKEWSQSGCKPADVCCLRVIDADIYLCILGGRYGHIEPSLNISMTEMEFQTALSSGKPILTFILDPLNPTTEEEEARERQKRFIDELKSRRILATFKDLEELRRLAEKDIKKLLSSK